MKNGFHGLNFLKIFLMSETKQIMNENRYRVIPRSLIFVFDDKERVLLIKGSSGKKLWSGQLNGLGGHIEAGEDILESATRELEEETGLSRLPLELCGQIMIDVKEDLGVALFLFRCFYNGEKLISSSEGRLCWVSIDSLSAFPVVEDLPVLLPKVLRYKPGNSPIIGRYSYDSSGKLKISIR